MDELIDLITKRVVDRLKQDGVLDKIVENLDASSGSCVIGDADCINCGHCAVEQPEAVKNILAGGADRIGSKTGIDGGKVDRSLASIIDHTLLKPDASREELLKICEEAKQFSFATVCVNSSNIPLVVRQLRGSPVKAIAVVGFPLGAGTSQAKAFEAKEAIRSGAEEIDMVINIGALKSNDYKLVYDDIKAVVEAAKPHKVKVIIETAKLNTDEKITACTLAKTAGAAFVKTSTGFGGGGATVEDIALMKRVVGSDMEVKASGGIRTTEDAQKMVAAGADRIGASASVAIVTGPAGSQRRAFIE
ncbi:MAG: deoxyribose-phosphate aldolase [Candidatus Aminicenantes bacterium]|nr:deoxyribose-phosphate aldolase [Candidatus Aminicenantes bacterium]